MSIPCTNRVWEHSSQKGPALFLLVAIADYADENGFAFPGLATLATRIRMSRRQTMRLVARLEDAGELLVLRRQGRGNLYIVRTAAGRDALAAALDRALSFGATLPAGSGSAHEGRAGSGSAHEGRAGSVQRALDELLGVEPQPVTSCPGTPGHLPSPPAPLSTGDKIMSPDRTVSPDRAMSHPCDSLGATGDRSRPTGDRVVTTSGDIVMAPDPSLSSSDPPGTVIDPSAQVLWARVLNYLPLYMGRPTFNQWLLGTRALAREGDCLIVEARTARAVEWIENRLAPIIDRAVSTYLPGIHVRFVAPVPAPGTDPVPAPGTDPGTPTGAVHHPPIPGPTPHSPPALGQNLTRRPTPRSARPWSTDPACTPTPRPTRFPRSYLPRPLALEIIVSPENFPQRPTLRPRSLSALSLLSASVVHHHPTR